ncbi:hypothetical protein PENCOP_c006G00451 [Penicillium coprophilum]|uniref:DRBM domain-containing protein n=1 Tax=Penicillium coprophilum TaxID=36646 RepID=A0A1V6UNI4_9EURO|nr:hypothetical protein PENCOP_c006G00451 [Penicillium coprophilum]
MSSKLPHTASMFELEAIEKLRIFELDGSDCSHDQDEWLGIHVWGIFIRIKFIESRPEAGLSPSIHELDRLFSKGFNSTGAIKQMVEADPYLAKSLHHSSKPSLFKALGLAVRNTSLSIGQIVATLSQFCQYNAGNSSQEQCVAATISNEPLISLSDRGGAESRRLSDTPNDTQHIREDHEYTSALKEMGDSECHSPKYTLIRLGFDPPRWSAVVQYRGTQSSAKASSKKAAKHSASKSLWLQMGKEPIF